MFSCKYKFNLEDNTKGVKYVLWHNTTWKTLWILSIVLISLALVIFFIDNVMTAMSGQIDFVSLSFDFILVFCLVFIILIPSLQISASRKIYLQSLADKDLMNVNINEYKCEVEFYKNNEMTNKEVLELTSLTAVGEDEKDFILVFNKNKFVLLKKDKFEGEIDLFRKLVKNYLKKEISRI